VIRTRIIVLLAALIVTALALPFALAWYVIYTEPGVNLVVRHLPQRFGATEVELRGVHGSIAHGLHLDQLLIRTRRVHLTFDNVNIQLELAPTLLQTLHARRLDIGNLRIQVIRRTTPYVASQLYFLPHWLTVQIDAMHIAHGTLIQPSGRELTGADLRAHGTVHSRTARFFDGSLRAGDTLFTAPQGTLWITTILGVAAHLGIDYHVPGQVPWQVRIEGDGDLNNLPFAAHIQAPFRGSFTGRGLDLTNQWHFAGRLGVSHIALDTWGASSRLGSAHGELAVLFDEHGFSADGLVIPEALAAGVFNTHLRGAYARRTLTIFELAALHPASGTRLTAQGSWALEHGGPRLNLSGAWSHLSWPLVHTPAVHSEAGTYTLAGVWPYDFSGRGELSVTRVPPLAIEFTSALYPDHIQFKSATVSARDDPFGQLTFAGAAQWLPNHTWTASGTATDLNPAAFANVAAGKLTGAFQANGAGFHASDDFSVQVQNLTGVMHNLPARGSGHVARAGMVWRFDGVRAQLAGTYLNLDGTLSDRADLKFDIRSPDLSLVLPGLQGHVNGNGEIHGDWRDPAVQATVSAGALQFERVALGMIDARLDFDPQRHGPSHVDVHARGLTLGTRTIDDLRLKLDGEERNHDLDLAFVAHDFNVKAHGGGAFSNGEWRGRLGQMTIVGTESLNLSLEQAANFSLATTQIRLDSLCLRGSPAHLCVGGDWTRAQWSLQATAAELPMQTLTAGQSGDIDYRGVIGMTLKLHGGTGPAEGTLDARLAGAQLRHRLAGGKMEVTTLGSGDVMVTATPAKVTAQLGLDAGAQGSIKGQLEAMRNGAELRDLPVSGSIALTTGQLDFIPLYVPQVDRAAGKLAANLDVAGTLGAPLLSGSLTLAQGELDLYQINLAMREATLKATLQSNRLDFDGAAKFGDGHAAVRGGLEWRDKAAHGQFTLTGTQLRVADVPEAQIDASPNLTFKVDGPKIYVTGEVIVPRARIVPADLTHAVLASSDEVIVGASNPSAPNHYQVTSDITMTLGDDVTVEGMGLKGRLSGSITEHVTSDDQVTHANGEFNVAQGDYTAYGRKLEIERGRLIFTGGPIGDPGLDVRAVKHFDDPTAGATLAGINVRGTLRQPQLSFFSEPSLPQQQVVSLLLAGGGLVGAQTAGVAGTNAQRGATNGELLGQGAAILGQQLGSHVGITDVGMESNIYNETSLVLGRYLSPKLYVSYGLGLTQTLNVVKLRYTLGDHWTIRTEAGQVGGADLVYTLDK
jgi:translocation and assembly module TamB